MKYQLTAQVQRVLKEGKSEGWWYCTIGLGPGRITPGLGQLGIAGRPGVQ